MEGDEVLSNMDSLWFYSSVFLQPCSKHKESEHAGELQPRQQQGSAETHEATSSGSSGQAPKCVKEAAAQTEPRAAAGMARIAAARGWKERDERMAAAWQKEQRRRARVAVAARCTQAPLPLPGEGAAMKAHLRSWAYAVACSVR